MKAYILQLAWKPTIYGRSNVLFFDGVGYDDKTIPITNKYELAADKITESTLHGEWVAAISNEDHSITVRIDDFGFYHLFYTTPALNQSGISAASNNFEALVKYLKSQGCHPQIDMSYAAPLLASSNSLFNQAYSKRTCCSQINRLLPGEVIRITSNAIRVEESNLLDLDPTENYDDLIDIGIRKCQNQLNSFQAEGNIKERILFLSGGKDSRACLSLLLSQQNIKFSCMTHPSPKSPQKNSEVLARDFTISSELVATFGLKWSSPTKKEATPQNFIDTLTSFQADRSNKYYYFNPAAFFTRNAESGFIVEFRGGGGEALRGYWGDYFRKLQVSSRFKLGKENILHDAKQIFQALVPKNLINSDLYATSMQDFANDIKSIPGNDIYEAMDNHYILHRNRYHFGNIRRSHEARIILYYPLAQTEFLRASRLLRYAPRSQGKLVYDIINEAYPPLHSFDYESGFFECAIQPSTLIPHPTQEIKKKEAEHLKIQNAIIEQNKELYKSPRLYDINSALQSKFIENIEILSKNSKELINIYQKKKESDPNLTVKSPLFMHLFTKIDGMAQIYDSHQNYSTIQL